MASNGPDLVRLSIHFDGPITQDHMLSVRAMAKTYEHIQRAIDRSFLIGKYGAVWKHARLKGEDYEEVSFLAAYPQEGGIILDAIKTRARVSAEVLDRIASVMREPFRRAVEGGFTENALLREQLTQRRRYASERGVSELPNLQSIIESPPVEWRNSYSSRSILKEVDQLTGQITPGRYEGSSVEIAFTGDYARDVFSFTPEIAKRFHTLVSVKDLGPVVVVNARIRDLDRGNRYSKPSAKIVNLDSGREVALHLSGSQDFELLHPHHTADSVLMLVSPFLEAGGFDVMGGDLFFVGLP